MSLTELLLIMKQIIHFLFQKIKADLTYLVLIIAWFHLIGLDGAPHVWEF